MPDGPTGRAFPFAFDPGLRRWARGSGVLPTRSFVVLDRRGFEACFGPWRLATPWSNVDAIERTGPYTPWKVAGPARLSLADRGLTMSATASAGVCVSFRRPERGIDPFGLVRHPAITLGVDDVEGFIALARRFLAATVTSGSVLERPHHPKGGFVAATQALWRWNRRGGSVTHRRRTVDDVPAPPPDGATADAQPIEEGAGPRYHRRYRIAVREATRPLDDVVAAIGTDLNRLADVDFSPFTKLRGELGRLAVGDRYLVEIAGPWKGAVEVAAVDRRNLRMSTLDGHMEAGVIEFRFAEHGPGRQSLTIESWSRSRDRALDLLYDKAGLARALQSQMWVRACEHFAELTGGLPDGPVEVATERADPSAAARPTVTSTG